MSWEEKIFQKAWHGLRGLVVPEKKVPLGQAFLHELHQRLTVLARALSGDALEIAPATAEGGFAGNVLYLPTVCSISEDKEINEKFYIFRTAYLCAQRDLGLNWTDQKYQNIAESRRRASQTAPQVLALMDTEYPGLMPVVQQIIALEENRQRILNKDNPDFSLLYGRWLRGLADLTQKEKDSHSNLADEAGGHADDSEIETELSGKAAEELEILEVDKSRIEEYTLSHNFEKVETLTEFQGTWREMDGSDELEDHQEALDQMNISKLVRTDDPVHSIYGLDFFRESEAGGVRRKKTKQFHIMYPEWDVHRRTYRKDYTTLIPEVLTHSRTGYAAGVLKEHQQAYDRITHAFEKVMNRPRWIMRQMDGSDPDTSALVNRFADLQAGSTPSRRIYMERRHRQSDTSVLILLDLSLSADGYVDNRRILDRETEAVVLIGEAMAQAGLEFQVDGFSSRTRNAVFYKHFKLFSELWRDCRDRLGRASSGGYTRIGAALRHGNFLLEKRPARRRWMLLLSDAKPNDYDRYEGRYGIADVRQALRESARKGIGVYTLALDPAARGHMPLMLGPGQYTMLNHPNELPDVMAQLILKFRA